MVYYLFIYLVSLIIYRSVCFLLFKVQYQSDQFLDKNKDYVVPEHQDLLSVSKCSFVAGLFPVMPEETTKSSKFSSIASRFKVSDSIFYLFLLMNICFLFIAKA